jgi:hypothetical protein
MLPRTRRLAETLHAVLTGHPPCLARQTSCRYSASPRPSACTIAITLDRQPAALRSTRNSSKESSAPWRGSADGATEQVAREAGRRSPADGCLTAASRHGCRARRRRRPQATVRRPAGGGVIVVAQMSGCLPRLGRPVRLLGQRPRVRCPVSVPAMSTRPVSNVRVWTSGVPRRCPHVPRPRCPHQVTSWSASVRRGSHTARSGPGLAVLPYPRTARPSG